MKINASANPAPSPRNEAESAKTKEDGGQPNLKEMAPQIGKQKMPPNPELNNIRPASSHHATMTVRRSYGMVISSYENVVRRGGLSGEAAEQLGATVDRRIEELNDAARKQIEALPEYRNLKVDDLSDLGGELEDLMTDDEHYLRAFELLKHPEFAQLMESTESIHRSFAEMMEENGKETLMFGVFEMIREMGGLAKSQDSQVVADQGKRVNIQV